MLLKKRLSKLGTKKDLIVCEVSLSTRTVFVPKAYVIASRNITISIRSLNPHYKYS
jgi:hypothetical protein